MGKTFFRKKLNDWFIEQSKQSFEKRPKFNLKTITIIFGGILFITCMGILIFSSTDDERASMKASAKIDYNKPSANGTAAVTSETSQPRNQNQSGFVDMSHGIGYGGVSLGGGASTRSRNANQVIRRGANGNDPGANLSLGTTIGATLVTNVLSTNTASPVIAVISQEMTTQNGTSIPAGSKAIGGATYDDASRRIQLRFSSLVYPEGDQHPIQAIAMMPDGSAGISGDYHSGEAKRQAGRFIGNFIGGMADGMKERIAGGGFGGGSIEPGSIKNGLLNGVTLSAEDQAKAYSDDLTSEKPTMSINSGFQFLLFLEKEYLP